MIFDVNLEKTGVKKILIIDKKQENLEAARTYFSYDHQTRVDYAQSAIDGIKMIHQEYSNKKYDLVLIDLINEGDITGADVLNEALKHQGLGIVVTEYTNSEEYSSTKIIGHGIEKLLNYNKTNPLFWKQVERVLFEFILGDGKEFYEKLQRYYTYVGKPI